MRRALRVNGATVKRIRKARGYTEQAAAEEVGLDSETYQAIEETGQPITTTRVHSIARTLAVPVQFLFFENVVLSKTIPDFRTTANRPAVLTPSGLKHIERAKSILNYINDENVGLVNSADSEERHRDTTIQYMRKLLVKAYTQNGDVDPTITFRNTRVAIEKSGVLVFCDRVKKDDFRGFCLSNDEKFPLIFINTAGQRPGTKLFTLMHELAHVHLNASGVSDPGILNNTIEQKCNKLVATLLLPEREFIQYFESIKSKSPSTIASLLAKKFGVSKQSCAIRIDELGLDSSFYSRWIKLQPKHLPIYEEEKEDDEDKPGGGGIGAQVSRFGYLLPKTLGDAISNRSISAIDAFRLTRLKPPTMQKLADIGRNRLD